MLRLRPAGVACPELVEACPEPSRRGLSTNGKRTTANRAVRPERSAAKSKGNRSISYPYFKKDSYISSCLPARPQPYMAYAYCCDQSPVLTNGNHWLLGSPICRTRPAASWHWLSPAVVGATARLHGPPLGCLRWSRGSRALTAWHALSPAGRPSPRLPARSCGSRYCSRGRGRSLAVVADGTAGPSDP